MERRKELQRIVEAYQRREEILVGRPVTWAIQLGLLALLAAVFWLVYSGAELDSVLLRGVVGFALFAGIGYAAGRLLEKPPVPEPISPPPKEEAAGEQSTLRLSTEMLRPGMVLAEPVRKHDGEVLIIEGTTLSDELLGVMREYEVPEAVVNFAEGGEEHDEQAAGK